VIGAITKVAAHRFPVKERATASGLGMTTSLLGLAILTSACVILTTMLCESPVHEENQKN